MLEVYPGATYLYMCLAAGAATLIVYWALRPSIRRLPYPPGPPRHWIAGHARYFFTPHVWLRYMSFKEQYGNVVHLEAFGNHTIVLNAREDAIELLDRRSNNYSDRPYIPMVDLMGWDFTTAFKRYTDPAWRKHRRLLQQEFKPSSAARFAEKQADKNVIFLNSILTRPEDFMVHIRALSAAIVMSTVYGYDITSTEDQFVNIVEKAVAVLGATLPGAAVVNIVPCLRFVPSWFPGAGFQRYAQSASRLVGDMLCVPFEYTRKEIALGTEVPSIVSSHMDACKTADDHRILQEVAATGYAAGADTTSSTLATFFLAMAMFPDIQKKAQDEIDRVVGASSRLMTYSDQASVPYIQALCRELQRWHPVLPLCVSHCATEDDVYKGWYIPKGTTVIPNVWAMTRNPSVYADADRFMPERFLDENGKLTNDDVSYVFGFGRRICPGRHMATQTVWLAVARMLSLFDIQPTKDAQGNTIPLSDGYTDGLLVYPVPFKCEITPRSDRARDIVLNASLSI